MQFDLSKPETLSAEVAGCHLRLIRHEDFENLGRYFDGLSQATRHRFGPHPLDFPTAKALCDASDDLSILRWLAFRDEAVVAYIILELRVGEHETARYAQKQKHLDPKMDCTVAPSVSDSFQGKGIGTALMQHIVSVARGIGRRYMVL